LLSKISIIPPVFLFAEQLTDNERRHFKISQNASKK